MRKLEYRPKAITKELISESLNIIVQDRPCKTEDEAKAVIESWKAGLLLRYIVASWIDVYKINEYTDGEYISAIDLETSLEPIVMKGGSSE